MIDPPHIELVIIKVKVASELKRSILDDGAWIACSAIRFVKQCDGSYVIEMHV